jgi:hypothetical protein
MSELAAAVRRRRAQLDGSNQRTVEGGNKNGIKNKSSSLIHQTSSVLDRHSDTGALQGWLSKKGFSERLNKKIIFNFAFLCRKN